MKCFFTVIDKAPGEVVAADVFDFLAHHRGDRRAVRISDGESGLAPATMPADTWPDQRSPCSRELDVTSRRRGSISW